MPGWQNIPERRPRLLLLLSLVFLLTLHVFFEVSGYRRRFRNIPGNTIEELSDSRICARPDFILRSNRAKRALVEHGDAVGDAERARHLVGDDNHCHLEGVI